MKLKSENYLFKMYCEGTRKEQVRILKHLTRKRSNTITKLVYFNSLILSFSVLLYTGG